MTRPGAAPPPEETVTFGTETINFAVRHTSRRTLAITVNPDLSVTVTAPAGSDPSAVREKVRRRAPWILKQRDYFRAFLPAASPRLYVSGESHYYLGRQYRLKVVSGEGEEGVRLKGGYIVVSVRDGRGRDKARELVVRWLSARARAHFDRRLLQCWEVLRKYDIDLPQLRLRRMAKRWGSCGGGVIYLNPGLVRSPTRCIDYVIIHEMCHLKHPNHGEGFRRLLRRAMPDWERWKAKLETFGLS